jgi:hypothetical protein
MLCLSFVHKHPSLALLADGKDILDFYSDPSARSLYKLHIWGLLSRLNPLTTLNNPHNPHKTLTTRRPLDTGWASQLEHAACCLTCCVCRSCTLSHSCVCRWQRHSGLLLRPCRPFAVQAAHMGPAEPTQPPHRTGPKGRPNHLFLQHHQRATLPRYGQ